MEVLHQRCAGMDISKRDAKVCVRTPGTRHNTFVKVVTVSGAMTKDILVLRDYLLAEQVTIVVMEATGDYWKPFVRHEALRSSTTSRQETLRTSSTTDTSVN